MKVSSSSEKLVVPAEVIALLDPIEQVALRIMVREGRAEIVPEVPG